jgi:hypothetical protein
MNEPCYRGQFLGSVTRTDPGDARDLALAEIKKIHGRGPSTPGDLRKRAPATLDLDAQLRKMAQSNEQRRDASEADATLDVIRKIQRRGPTGAGPFLPEPPVRKRNVGRLIVDDRELTWMSRRVNVRKGSALNAVGTLPGQDSDGDTVADPGRAGAVSGLSGYQDDGWRNVQPTRGAPNTAAINSRDALPSDSDAEKGKARADEDRKVRSGYFGTVRERASLNGPQRGPTSEATKAIRAIHRAGSERLFGR